jgi:hypothetical protein
MRLASACSLFVLLGLGGLALAQEGTIVDPWKHDVSTVLAARAVEVHRTDTSPAQGKRAANARPKGPSVVPVGPPLRSSSDPWAFVPAGLAEAGDGIVDPWAAPRGPGLASRDGRRAPAWARQIPDIVDPWAKGPVAVVSRDPLIVDPWAP